MQGDHGMPSTTNRKSTTRGRKATNEKQLVSFRFEGREYVLDLVRNQVYLNWMAVETNKGVTILGAYRSLEPVTV